MKKLLMLSAISALLIPVTVQAAEKDTYFSVLLGGAYESIEEGHTLTHFTGPVHLNFDNSLDFQARLGHFYTPNLGVEFMIEDAPAFQMNGAVYDRLEVQHIAVNGKWRCMAWPRFHPYASAGIGYMHAGEKISYSGTNLETSDKDISLRGGIGYDYMLKDSFSMGLEAAYTTGTGDVNHIEYMTVISSFSYYF